MERVKIDYFDNLVNLKTVMALEAFPFSNETLKDTLNADESIFVVWHQTSHFSRHPMTTFILKLWVGTFCHALFPYDNPTAAYLT